MKVAASIIGILVVVLGLTWIIQGNDFFMYKFFGIKYENVRREIFEQSQAYNQGMVQELDNMMFEYQGADKEHKAALASIFLRRASYYGIEKLPPDLKQFANQLKERKDY
jgi:hypothetical protein